MATWDDVRRVAAGLPETEERPARSWRVAGRAFAVERPLRRADLEHLGDAVPDEAPLALWVADLGEKEALLAESGFFTTPHFDGYAMVLVRLGELGVDELTEVVTDSWLTRAPRALARRWTDAR